MKDVIRFAFILTVTAAVTSGSLAYVNSVTRPRIIARQNDEMKEALRYVLQGSENGIIEPVSRDGEILFYKAYQKPDKRDLIGYAFVASGQGYSSEIQTMVGISPGGEIFRIRILFQQETPGLGTECVEIRKNESAPWWQKQFEGAPASSLQLDKDGGMIQTITGATITSRAVTESIAVKAKQILEKTGELEK